MASHRKLDISYGENSPTNSKHLSTKKLADEPQAGAISCGNVDCQYKMTHPLWAHALQILNTVLTRNEPEQIPTLSVQKQHDAMLL